MAPESELLFLCARGRRTNEANARIRELLSKGIDWTTFVGKARSHGLVSIVASALAESGSELTPGEILAAFDVAFKRIRDRNRALFEELTRVLSALAGGGVQAIPFKGPILALEAYGDLALREFRDLDFLLHDNDVDKAMPILRDLGYRRGANMTETQARLVQRIQGQEILFNDSTGIAIEPHTRLVPLKISLRIDYAALWHRARETTWNGFTARTLTPADSLLLLAIHGGKEFWWRMNWVADVAAFADAHQTFDWHEVLERSRMQGSRRMLVLAASLARKYFAANLPDEIVRLERADPLVDKMVQRIGSRWREDKVRGPPSNRTLSLDRLRLHDRLPQRASYIMRTWFLPGPEIVTWIALPGVLSFAYIPLKVLHDAIMLPLWRLFCAVARPHKKPALPHG